MRSYHLIRRELLWYKMKRATGVDGGDEAVRMGMYLMPLNCTCTVVKMVNCMPFVSYHNLKKAYMSL